MFLIRDLKTFLKHAVNVSMIKVIQLYLLCNYTFLLTVGYFSGTLMILRK